jgi:hypothetical protein
MNFDEVNIFGVYVAPIAPMMLAAWVAMIPLRWIGHRARVARYVWHPALFGFSIYVIVLAAIVLAVGR